MQIDNFAIPIGHKYGCIAVTGARIVRLDSDSVIDLGAGLKVQTRPPVEVPAHWTDWFGSEFARRIERADLFLVAMQRSEQVGILNAENRTLCERVHNLLLAMSICGVFRASQMAYVGGGSEDGSPGVRDVSLNIKKYAYIDRRGPAEVNTDYLRQAAACVDGIGRVFSHKMRLPADPMTRLRLGLVSLMDALHERYLPSRIHLAVRALEAIVCPRIMKTRDDVAHRCRTFVRGADVSNVIGEIYDLRCSMEHLHMAWPNTFSTLSDNDKLRRAEERAIQADAVVGAVYRRILSDIQLMNELFKNNNSLDSFWASSDADRQAKWGDKLDIGTIRIG